MIRRGGLVAFPTETVYGLGADATNPKAVRNIFRAKGRPATDPLIVHISEPVEIGMVAARLTPATHVLAETFWPGPLTLVVDKREDIPPEVTAGLPTAGVRCPAHPVATGLIRAAGCPIAAPSANRFSHVSPTCAEHVLFDLDGRIELVLDAGSTQVGLESTVLSARDNAVEIYRPGGVSRERIEAALKQAGMCMPVILKGEAESPGVSPGMLEKHYAPNAPVILFAGDRQRCLHEMHRMAEEWTRDGHSVAFLISDEDAAELGKAPDQHLTFLLGCSIAQTARRLYAGLRELDSLGADIILARAAEGGELAEAINDRLTRACGGGGRVIRV